MCGESCLIRLSYQLTDNVTTSYAAFFLDLLNHHTDPFTLKARVFDFQHSNINIYVAS